MLAGETFIKLNLVSWSHCPTAQFIFYLGAQLPDPADCNGQVKTDT
jgi:hypothetical protein